MYAQIIDDRLHKTLTSVSDVTLAGKDKKVTGTKLDLAKLVGEALAKKAIQLKIIQVSFDRSHYKFHGRVKALADAARSNGLEF
jgi:large subunit ribosomal protein L18